MIITEDELFIQEPVHDTYRKEYKKTLDGEKLIINPIGAIFCWSRALNQRGMLD